MKRVISFDFELLDGMEQFKKKIRPLTSSLSYSSLATIKRKADLKIEDDSGIDYLNDRLRIFCTIDGVRVALATLLLSSAKKDKSKQERTIYCFDKLLILEQDKIEERLYIAKGANVIDRVKALILPLNHAIQDYGGTTSTEKEYPVGTAKLSIINDLLSVINFNSLSTNEEGLFFTSQYILPNERTPDITYRDQPNVSIVKKELEEEIDVYDTPNVFVRCTNNTDITPPLTVMYENNDPSSLVSTVSRGRRIVDFKEVQDVADYETLLGIAKKDAYNASDIYSYTTLKTGINHAHGFLNCIRLELDSYNIRQNYIETEWRINDCKAGGEMTHTLRRVISL